MKMATLSDEVEAMIEKKGVATAEQLMEYMQHELAKMIGDEKYSTLIQAVAYGHMSIMLIATHVKMMSMTNPVDVTDYTITRVAEMIVDKAIALSKTLKLHRYSEISGN